MGSFIEERPGQLDANHRQHHGPSPGCSQFTRVNAPKSRLVYCFINYMPYDIPSVHRRIANILLFVIRIKMVYTGAQSPA